MHLIEPIKSCIEHSLETAGPGMKALLMDKTTTAIVSAGYSKSQLLQKEVYVIEQVDNVSTESNNFVKCIVIISPTSDNIQLLCKELEIPHYKSYYLFFTFKLKFEFVQNLAVADQNEVVRCLIEFPIDYQAVNPFIYSLQLNNCIYDNRSRDWDDDSLTKACQGLASVLFCLKKNPVIRYHARSQLCQHLAEKLSTIVREETDISWRKTCPYDVSSLLLLIDRRFDAVTPLISSWNYYSIIHNEFKIENNRIDLLQIPKRQPKDPKEMLLSFESDKFFSEHYYKTYAEIAPLLKQLIDELKNKSAKKKLDTLKDMKKVINEIPEARRHTSNVYNHLFLMTELGRIINDHHLFELSECQIEMVGSVTSVSKDVSKKIKDLVANVQVRKIDAIRLVGLYAVLYPKSSFLTTLMSTLKSRPDVSVEDIHAVRRLKIYQYNKSTSFQPVTPASIDATVQNVARKLARNVKSSETYLTYQPSLAKIIDDLKRGKLREVDYPFQGEKLLSNHAPENLILFFVGGFTYEESLIVDKINRDPDYNMKIVIGGTSIHNVDSFMEEIQKAFVND